MSDDGDIPKPLSDWLEKREARRLGVKKPKKTYQLKRSKLNPVSKKQKKRNKDYKDARVKHYSNESNRQCAICGKTENLSIHHKEGRGSNSANENTFVTLCILGTRFNELYPDLNHNEGLGCHQGVERNKTWARQHGYLS